MVARKKLNEALENSLENFVRQVQESAQDIAKALLTDDAKVLGTFHDRVIFQSGDRVYTSYLVATIEGISVDVPEDMGLVEDDMEVDPYRDVYQSAAHAFMGGQTTLAESILRSAVTESPEEQARFAIALLKAPMQFHSIPGLERELKVEDVVPFNLKPIVEGRLPVWDLQEAAPLVDRDLDSVISRYEGLSRTIFEAVSNFDITDLSESNALSVHLATDLSDQVRIMNAAARSTDIKLKAELCQTLSEMWPTYAAVSRLAGVGQVAP